MDEMVNIVDENDKIIGQELKSKCHRGNILHRGAGVICFKDESFSEILLTKRSLTKSHSPGLLCLPGGHLGLGESYEDGARREFIEEVCVGMRLDGIKFDPVFKIKKTVSDNSEFVTIFRIIYPGPFLFDEKEVAEVYFEKTEKVIEAVNSDSHNFSKTAALLIKEYASRFID